MKQFRIGGFYAYPSTPGSVGDAIRVAIPKINEQCPIVNLSSWENLPIAGRHIGTVIQQAIANAQLFCADLTGLNPNVLFELGYAIARDKRIWLSIDNSLYEAKTAIQRFQLLSTLGYRNACNATQLASAYVQDSPHSNLADTAFERHIKPRLGISAEPRLLYLKPMHPIQASIAVSHMVETQRYLAMIDDPQEGSAPTLPWYGNEAFNAIGVLCHLDNPKREGAILGNARQALVAGLASGFGRPVLMLCEDDFLAPVDYRNMLRTFSSTEEAERYAGEWLKGLADSQDESGNVTSQWATRMKLATDLARLDLGQWMAENEPTTFVSDYFVETSAYREAASGQIPICVGRKGVGKTANLLKISMELCQDKHNLVCVIKPPAYEMQALVRLLDSYRHLDLKSYAIESLWKFLILSEIVLGSAKEIGSRTYAGLTAAEQALLDLVESNSGLLAKDFSIRLEHAVALLEPSARDVSGSTEEGRIAISETLHGGLIKDLRIALAGVLCRYKRVAVLMDNLDNAWDARFPLATLAEFILGLLGAARRLPIELAKGTGTLPPITLTLFLRSDIFNRVIEHAREPDKIAYSRIEWDDREMLLRVIEERISASTGASMTPEELWGRFFCAAVDGMPTRDYIVDRVVPRPRDIIYLTRAAVENAVNRKHAVVQEKDVLDAEKRYSWYALEGLFVESAVGDPWVGAVITEFIGGKRVWTMEGLASAMSVAGVDQADLSARIKQLCLLSFLGVEVDDNKFRFAEEARELERLTALSRRFGERAARAPRFAVRKPFWAYLELRD